MNQAIIKTEHALSSSLLSWHQWQVAGAIEHKKILVLIPPLWLHGLDRPSHEQCINDLCQQKN